MLLGIYYLSDYKSNLKSENVLFVLVHYILMDI